MESHKLWFKDYAEAKIEEARNGFNKTESHGGKQGLNTEANVKTAPDMASDLTPLTVKITHTFKVLDNAEAIAKTESFSPDIMRAISFAALYHDLARFDQYILYGTFKDRISRNHGAWSVELLKKYKRLKNEPPYLQKLIRIAIGLHNRRALPESFTGISRKICEVIRDADKLDILRIMAGHLAGADQKNPTVILDLPDDPKLTGPNVIPAALEGLTIGYEDLRSLNDFRVLLGSWYFALSFRGSRKLFKEAGHGLSLAQDLPDNEIYGKVRAMLIHKLTT